MSKEIKSLKKTIEQAIAQLEKTHTIVNCFGYFSKSKDFFILNGYIPVSTSSYEQTQVAIPSKDPKEVKKILNRNKVKSYTFYLDGKRYSK